ncbi:MAG: hypothetical protein JNM62_03255 [Flavobacteriales bacterium]|nr:hypothetical protein [Flavobacteriales bacterium]
MRTSLAAALVVLSGSLHAQVSLDVPVDLTGTIDQRRVEGLAYPAEPTSAITVAGALVTGGYSWCTATSQADTITLHAEPGITTYSTGLKLRFQMPVELAGDLFIACEGLDPVPLRRADGLNAVPGQLTTGVIVEVLHAAGSFILMNRMERGCAPGFLPAHEHLCMQVQPTTGMTFHQAVNRCGDLGGKLCSWDDYIAACTALQGQLTGLFADWEWIDDSSNHQHGADAAGRYTCISQRNVSPIPTFTATVRCCYHPR